MATPDEEAHWLHHTSKKGLAYSLYTKPIQKSPQDDRDYRLIRLDNGLQAMLVQDTKADKSAASLDVAVGHLDDPVDMPGLAHFCEHLLFMGTEQFPKENEYSEYLSKNNGSSNAFTASHNTNYYFNVATPMLQGALERFSAFFHSPLFSPSCTMRELNAVDSENKKNLQNDMWRIFQLNKYLTKPGHPWSKFGTGNKESLTQAGKDAKAKGLLNGTDGKKSVTGNSLAPSPIPSRVASPALSTNSATSETEADGGLVGQETRRRLIEWWSKEYCAGRMRVCVLGKESLDELSEMVVDLFSPIKNHGRDPSPVIQDHPFGSNEKGKLISVQTVMDFHAIEISFPFQYQPPSWRHKPGQLLADLVGHEGPGSLHSYLKNKGWVTAIQSGPQELGRGFEMFKVTLYLTEDGFKNHRACALAAFNYLSLLRSQPLPAWFQRERSLISNIRFRFLEKRRPDNFAVSVSEHLAYPIPRDLTIKAAHVVWEWDAEGEAEKEAQHALESLRVGEGRAVLMAKKEDHERITGKKEWQKEPWYGTDFRVENFDEEFVKLAEGPNVIQELHLPRPNDFIPQNLDVDKREVAESQPRPHLVRETALSSLWHKKDDRFWVPKAYVMVDIRTPVANESPLASVLTRIYAELVTDSLSEYAYAAELAGLGSNVAVSTLGIFVSVSGYNDKLHVLLRDVLERLKNVQIKADRLEVMKEQAKREWQNFFLGQSYRVSDYFTRYLMVEQQWTIAEKLQVIDSVTVEKVEEHMKKLLSRTYSRILVEGNIYKDEAADLAKMSEEIISPSPMPPSEMVDLSLQLPEGSNHVWSIPVPNPNEPNSSLSYYVHFGPLIDQRPRVVSVLLTQILSEPAFNVLRTKEQLGYIVSASQWVAPGANESGLRIVVQSERGPVYLEERIEAFLEHMKGVIEAMGEDEFLEQKAGLERRWTETPKNLSEEVNRHWAHIDSGYLDFLRRSKDVAELATVTKDEVLALFLSHVHPSSTTRSKLSVHSRSQQPRPKHVSLAAAEAFERLVQEAGIAVDGISWREDFAADAEPLASDFTKHWEGEAVEKLLVALPELLEMHPARADSEGALRDGVIHIEDPKAFRASLKVSEPPKPLVEWGDLPTSRF